LSAPFRITTRIDFEAEGRQFRSLDVHSGILIGRHAPGLIKPGDCLAVVATDCAGSVT
jgi:predicted deacylase